MTGELIQTQKQQSKNHRENISKGIKFAKEISEYTKHVVPEQVRRLMQKQILPIPKGETAYALAKNAEYKDRDLDKAEFFYKKAIRTCDRTESAIKDLASLLHQRGKTKEACELLDKYRNLFTKDQEKFKNLYKTLEKQILSTGNSQNKSLKLSNLNEEDSISQIQNLFENSIRIQSFEFGNEEIDGKINYYCILKFNSHSSARKTLEGFHLWDKYKIEWMSIYGQIVGDAHYARQKMEEYRKLNPAFDYSLFERDPQGYIYCLPLETPIELTLKKHASEIEDTAENLLGKNLFSTIFKEIQV